MSRIRKNIFYISYVISAILIINWNSYAQSDSSNYIGKYKVKKVVDGDTFKFEGMESSTRLVCIDTEETFKGKDAEKKTAEIEPNWPQYYKEVKGNAKMPVKCDTPFGYEAYLWANELFKDIDSAILETDDSSRTIDIYNRSLVYIFYYKDGVKYNYNLECVRSGYSPYFVKYGYSNRFHQLFSDAQKYAKENKLGIWNSKTECYPDYDIRLEWWEKRAKQLKYFAEKYQSSPTYFNLLNSDFNNLYDLDGAEITIFGLISEIIIDENKIKIRMTHSRGESVDLIIYKENFENIDINEIYAIKEYYIYVKGVLKVSNKRISMVLKKRNQIWQEE
jgi:endonuclease YncB( thermonuclease family)